MLSLNLQKQAYRKRFLPELRRLRKHHLKLDNKYIPYFKSKKKSIWNSLKEPLLILNGDKSDLQGK